jgi:hypothetical protein
MCQLPDTAGLLKSLDFFRLLPHVAKALPRKFIIFLHKKASSEQMKELREAISALAFRAEAEGCNQIGGLAAAAPLSAPQAAPVRTGEEGRSRLCH